MENKSFGTAIRETRDALIKVLNESNLPIDVMDMLLGEIKINVHAQAEQEYMMEMAKQQEKAKPEKKE